jgi:CBS domain-containing protein
MKVKDIMSGDVEVTRPEDTLQMAAARMASLDSGVLPVCEGEKLVGILTDRDITVRSTAEGTNPTEGVVKDVMTPNVVYCFEEDDPGDAARKMEQEQIRRLPVVDREMHLVGIVSLGDLSVRGEADVAGEALHEVSKPDA